MVTLVVSANTAVGGVQIGLILAVAGTVTGITGTAVGLVNLLRVIHVGQAVHASMQAMHKTLAEMHTTMKKRDEKS